MDLSNASVWWVAAGIAVPAIAQDIVLKVQRPLLGGKASQPDEIAPIKRGARCVPPAPGSSPRLISGNARRAPGAAMR